MRNHVDIFTHVNFLPRDISRFVVVKRRPDLILEPSLSNIRAVILDSRFISPKKQLALWQIDDMPAEYIASGEIHFDRKHGRLAMSKHGPPYGKIKESEAPFIQNAVRHLIGPSILIEAAKHCQSLNRFIETAYEHMELPVEIEQRIAS